MELQQVFSASPQRTSRTTSQDSSPAIDGQIRQNEFLSNDERYAGLPGTPKPIPCEFCGKLRYTRGFALGERIFWFPSGAEVCDCAEAQEAERVRKERRRLEEEAERKRKEEAALRDRVTRYIGQSGMGNRFLQRTFDSFQIADDNRRAAQIAKAYADKFDDLLPRKGGSDPGKNGLFIAGKPGTGKTHLAAAISNQLLNRGISVICMTSIDLLNRIKRSYGSNGENEDAVLDIFKTVSLLVIDDLGKEKCTEWAISTIYNIVNARYEAYLPIIITTNYGTEALIERMTPAQSGDPMTAKATLDRLREVCKGVSLDGESWRGK